MIYESILSMAKVLENKESKLLELTPNELYDVMNEQEGDISRFAVLDTETSGLEDDDEITEIAIRVIQYNKRTGEWIKPLECYNSFQEISEKHHHKFAPTKEIQNSLSDAELREKYIITRVTNITLEHLKGQKIDWKLVNEIIDSVDFIAAHNAQFDKKKVQPFLTSDTKWYCTQRKIDWKSVVYEKTGQDCLSLSQESLCLQFGFFFDGHRAINDVDACAHLLKMAGVVKRLAQEEFEIIVTGWVDHSFLPVLRKLGFQYADHIYNDKSNRRSVPDIETREQIVKKLKDEANRINPRNNLNFEFKTSSV